MSAQLAVDAFGRSGPPIGLFVRLGGMLKHAFGIHTVIPSVEADMEDGVLKNIRQVQECAFCKARPGE